MEARSIGEMPSHYGHLIPLSNGTVTPHGNLPSMYLDTSRNMTNAGNSLCRGWNVFQGNEAYPTGQNLGSDIAHNTLQPYITCFMWQRTN